jgi:hypothetical protein
LIARLVDIEHRFAQSVEGLRGVRGQIAERRLPGFSDAHDLVAHRLARCRCRLRLGDLVGHNAHCVVKCDQHGGEFGRRAAGGLQHKRICADLRRHAVCGIDCSLGLGRDRVDDRLNRQFDVLDVGLELTGRCLAVPAGELSNSEPTSEPASLARL